MSKSFEAKLVVSLAVMKKFTGVLKKCPEDHVFVVVGVDHARLWGRWLLRYYCTTLLLL